MPALPEVEHLRRTLLRLLPGRPNVGAVLHRADSCVRVGEGLAGTRRAVKAALLDQTVIEGVGNIYADEALFLARIRPRRVAGRLRPEEIERLASAIRAVLESATESGGSTLRDYVDASG